MTGESHMKSGTKRRIPQRSIAGLSPCSVARATGATAQAVESSVDESAVSTSYQVQDSTEISPTVTNRIIVGHGDATSGMTLSGETVDTTDLDVGDLPAELFASEDSRVASTVLPAASFKSYEAETGTQILVRIGSAAASSNRFPLVIPDEAAAGGGIHGRS